MKYFLPVLLSVLLFAQCRDEGPTLNPDGSMKATIDGSPWQADVLEAAYVDGTLTLSGSSLDERAIVMGVAIGDLQPQTVAFLPGSPDGLTYTSVGGARTYVSNTADGDGFLRITEVDTAQEWISGRFEARCYRPQESGGVEITEGVFTKVPYTDSLPPIFSSGLRAVIDGATWTSDSITTTLSDGQIQVQSLGENDRQIRFRIPENADPGTYDLDPTGSFSATYITSRATPSAPNQERLPLTCSMRISAGWKALLTSKLPAVSKRSSLPMAASRSTIDVPPGTPAQSPPGYGPAFP